ncbi:FG-GAP-like repeat-containing protein [Phaeobacter sp. JH18-32]|uniref:FG-GAP repeat domain-containing protein n=1 Tax=Phaeobacter TaxID=302485 RepID=UPI003A888F39
MTLSNLSGSTMSIVAHVDDDLLFQNPDIINAIEAGGGHTTVFITAGDAGRDTAYMEAREDGAKAAYSYMTGHSDWVDETITLTNGTTEFFVQTSYLESQPDVRLYFLRLPDGNYNGGGYGVNNNESVERLWAGEIDTITTKDDVNTYTADDVSGLLLGLMEIHQPATLLLQDLNSDHASSDHSDHFNASQFAFEAHQYYETEHDLVSYIEYATSGMEANLDSEDAFDTREAMYEYILASGDITGARDANGNPVLSWGYNAWLAGHYHNEDIGQLEGSTLWSADFGNSDAGWDNDQHVRTLGDINGDGMADLVGFGGNGVHTAQSDGSSFGTEALGLSNMAFSVGGWRVDSHEREVADVNGDGFDDVIGFGGGDTFAALSNGNGGFVNFSTWSSDYASNDGWDVDQHERLLGDVNGDGMADVVAFGSHGTEVAMSNGSGFEDGSVWINDFDFARGWRIGNHERVLADVNGDGMDDIVGFGASRVIVSTSNGDSFDPIELWSTEFSSADGWREAIHERELADVNGDGMADIVAFGEDGVQVALSNGNGFAPSQVWSEDFGNNDGWSQEDDTRSLADVNGDGIADIVAFGNDGVRVSLSDGGSFVDPFKGDAPFATLTPLGDKAQDLLVNGGLDASVADNTWTSNGDVTGWTNDNGGIEAWGEGFLGIQTPTGGTIVELDRNAGANVDNLYQDVETEAGQLLELSFSSLQRGGDNDQIEVYWRGELVDTVQPEGNDDWSDHVFFVEGSGGLDRLEFRELASESDGTGPLMDNVSLMPASESDAALELMRSLFSPLEDEAAMPEPEEAVDLTDMDLF